MSHLLSNSGNPCTNFFANLPSNARVEGNTTARFRCRLARKLQFNSAWYVGLAEISYPHSWPSLGTSEPQHIDIQWRKSNRNARPTKSELDSQYYENLLGERSRIPVPRGRHISAERLESVLNNVVRQACEQISEETAKRLANYRNFRIRTSLDPNAEENVEFEQLMKKAERRVKDEKQLGQHIRFLYNSDLQRFLVDYTKVGGEDVNKGDMYNGFCGIEHIELSQQLAYILGFESGANVVSNTPATYTPDILGGISELYVYAPGLIEPVILGDVMSPLLRVVNVRGKPDDSAQETYVAPHYHKLLVKEISEILIEIRTNTGRLVPFEYGNCRLTLHFKKQPYF